MPTQPMQQVFQFINNHPLLALTWLILLVTLLVMGVKKRLSGVTTVSNSQAVRLINKSSAVVLDTRSKQAFDSGHITGALLVLASDIEANKLEWLEQYKARDVIVVSEDEGRAATFVTALHRLGFKQLSVLRDGISGWSSDHLPLTVDRVRQRAKVEMYTRKNCPFCVRAKALLAQHGVIFKEIAVDGDEVKKQEMIKRSGRTSVPQIFVDGKCIGGCDDLYAMEVKNSLESLLQ